MSEESESKIIAALNEVSHRCERIERVLVGDLDGTPGLLTRQKAVEDDVREIREHESSRRRTFWAAVCATVAALFSAALDMVGK